MRCKDKSWSLGYLGEQKAITTMYSQKIDTKIGVVICINCSLHIEDLSGSEPYTALEWMCEELCPLCSIYNVM